jgi:hypothetical protein
MVTLPPEWNELIGLLRSNGVALRFLGLSQLVTNKQASGRTKNLLDIELLREAGLLDEA